MLKKLIHFLKHPTSKDVITNTLGNYLNVFFTAFFALVLVRILNPAEYGVLSVLLGIAYVLSNILDFGTTATIYSYLPALMDDKRENLFRFIKSTFYYQSVFAVIVVIGLFLLFPFLDTVFFKTEAPVSTLYLTASTVMLFIWQNFITNILFAAKKFLKANIYLNLSNAVKAIIILVMAATHTVTIGGIIFVFGIVGPLLFFIFAFANRKDQLTEVMKAEVKREEFRFGYTMTYFVASQFYNLGTRMDLFLLSYFGLKGEVGYYGLAQKIILTIITTIVSITQVLSPLFSHTQTKRELVIHFRKALYYMLLPCGLFVGLFLTPDFIFRTFFTEKFVHAAQITRVLALPYILNALSSIPMLFLLYSVKKPKYILMSNILFFVCVTGGSYFLIPKYGMFGPPYAIATAFVATFILLAVATSYEYKQLKSR